MGVRCILLYSLPKGVLPVQADVERIVNALTQQLYCVPQHHDSSSVRSSKEPQAGAAGGQERALEASVTLFKQMTATDPSLIKEPKSLQDVRLYKLHRDAPSRLFMVLKSHRAELATHVTEAEPSLRTFLEKRLEYRQRGTLHIQSQSWFMGDKATDVTVKLLMVTQSGSPAPRLLAVEVTYHPATRLSTAGPVLQELADRIIACVGPATGSGPGQAGRLVLLQPKHFESQGVDPTDRSLLYGPMHIVELYNELLEEGLLGRHESASTQQRRVA